MTSHAPWSLAMLVLSLTMPTPALAWEERELDTTGASPVAHSLEPGGRARSTPGGAVSENEIVEAFTALQAADGYRDIVEVVAQHERVIASEQMVALDTPGNTWPTALLPLMQQSARN